MSEYWRANVPFIYERFSCRTKIFIMNSNGLGPWSFFFFFFSVSPPIPLPHRLPPPKKKIKTTTTTTTLLTPQVVKGSMSALVEKLKTERKEGEGNSGLKETLSRLLYNWAVSVCTWEPVFPLIPCNPAAPSWPFGKKKDTKANDD